MERRKLGSVVAAVGVSAFSLLAGACATYGGGLHGRYDYDERDRPLMGRRYEAMRSLAHDLDGRAEHAVNQARREARHRGRNTRRLLGDMEHFARRADDFHERMDRYRDSPWDVADEVAHLDRDARDVNREIREARVLERTYDDWDAVLDVLNRMNRVLAGRNGRDADRDYDR